MSWLAGTEIKSQYGQVNFFRQLFSRGGGKIFSNRSVFLKNFGFEFCRAAHQNPRAENMRLGNAKFDKLFLLENRIEATIFLLDVQTVFANQMMVCQ